MVPLNPSDFGWIGTVIFFITTGIAYFFPARRKELDQATAKLIKTLQETVQALERDLNIYKEKTLQLEEHQKENISKIEKLDTERDLLRNFIDGRDKKTEEFQNTTLTLHRQNSEKITELTSLLSKHFINMEKVAINK